MPYDVVPRGNQFCVIKQSDGSTVKCHDTMGQAEAHQQALYTSYYAEGEGKAVSFIDMDELKAVWTTAFVNNLPDSSFAYIEPGGTKDSEGKTTPRSLRHFPYKNADGLPDAAHVRNALARIPQSSVSDAAKASALAKVHAAASKLGIGKSLDVEGDEAVVYYGGAVKALGNGRVGGYGVLFTTADDPDLQGDFFTKATDLELEGRSGVLTLWDHGLDSTVKRRKLGKSTFRIDDAGVWFETKLDEADKYEKAIYGLAKAGKLGWSTGSAPHLVERVPVKKAFELKSWPVIEVSLTHMPVEPRTSAAALKSINHIDLDELIIEDEPIERPSFKDFSTPTLEAALKAAYDGDDVETHCLKVATAVEELLAHETKCLLTTEALGTRLNNRQEFRAVKDGRVFSQKHVELMTELAKQIRDSVKPHLDIADKLDKMITTAKTTRDQHEALAQAIQLQHNTFQQLKEANNG